MEIRTSLSRKVKSNIEYFLCPPAKAGGKAPAQFYSSFVFQKKLPIGFNFHYFQASKQQTGQLERSMNEATDAHIFSLLKDPATREKGFLQLMETYREPVYWHIRRLVVSHEDAEDILQETFLNVYRFAASFKGESHIFTWLYRIATNECTRHFRKNKKWQKQAEAITEHMAGELSGGDADNSDAMLVKFQQAILRLPEKQRIVFNLRYYDELSYEEMGQILNSSVNTLKTNYHYACEKIKEYLKQQA